MNTPETQQADCDLAVGLLVQAVAQSPYAADTLIIVTEDDCQDGPDHVDSHRATAYVVGPYVKQGAVVSTRYSQVNALRTIEDILGTQHINLNTAFQRPMADVFDIQFVRRVDLHRRGVDGAGDDDARARAGAARRASSRPGRRSSRSTTPRTGPRSPPASTSPTPTTCRRRSSTGCCGRA